MCAMLNEDAYEFDMIEGECKMVYLAPVAKISVVG